MRASPPAKHETRVNSSNLSPLQGRTHQSPPLHQKVKLVIENRNGEMSHQVKLASQTDRFSPDLLLSVTVSWEMLMQNVTNIATKEQTVKEHPDPKKFAFLNQIIQQTQNLDISLSKG